jgi:hypothetical protein
MRGGTSVADESRLTTLLADRRDQAFPVGGELDPAVVLGRLGDEGAAALEGFHQALALQEVDGLAHGDAGDAELALQLFQRGNFVADRPAAVADASAQHGGNLQIAGDAAVGVVEGERLARADGHGVVSLSSDALPVAPPCRPRLISLAGRRPYR